MIPYVFWQWSLSDLVSGNRELSATWCADDRRHCLWRQEQRPHRRQSLLCRLAVINNLRVLTMWMNLVRASWYPYAAKIGVTISLDEVDIECSQRIDIIVVTGIVVPCGRISITMRMDKCYDRWQTFVVAKYVREVRICFTTFVRIGVQIVTGVIDCVYRMLPSAKMSTRRPGRITVTHSGRRSATQSVFSCWSLPITMILSSGPDPGGEPIVIVSTVVDAKADGGLAGDSMFGPP